MSEDLEAKAENVVNPEEVEKALKESNDTGMRKVNMSCRRTSHLDGRPGAASGDGDLSNNTRKCPTNKAFIVNDVMEGARQGHMIYRCADCDYTWTVSTGSTFSY